MPLGAACNSPVAHPLITEKLDSKWLWAIPR